MGWRLDHISWHASHLGEELALGRVLEVQNTSLSQGFPPKSWGASLCLDDLHIWVQSWVLAASSQEQWSGHTETQTLFLVGGFQVLLGLFAFPQSSEHLIRLLSPSHRAHRTGTQVTRFFLPSPFPGIQDPRHG